VLQNSLNSVEGHHTVVHPSPFIAAGRRSPQAFDASRVPCGVSKDKRERHSCDRVCTGAGDTVLTTEEEVH
jgi:hypothetical protein